MNVNMNRNAVDLFYLQRAREMAAYSPDPSTKVGALLVQFANTARISDAKANFLNRDILGRGWNRPVGEMTVTMDELLDRSVKYKLMTHAEEAAIYNALLQGYPLRSFGALTLYVYGPIPVCGDCAIPVVESGIKSVVYSDLSALPEYAETYARWADSCSSAVDVFARNGVRVMPYKITGMTETELLVNSNAS